MTNQELYSKVRTHLLTQNKKSRSPEGRCAYRGEDGTRCAIGCLIADEDYNESLEGWSVRTELVRMAAGVDQLVPSQNHLAAALQWVHDMRSPENWPIELNAVANIFDLEAR